MEYFQEMADQMVLLKMSPYFDLAHVILCAVAVREDIHQENRGFPSRHSLSCWISTIMKVFAGSLVANGLLGEPILAPLANNELIYMTTIVWYLVFYSPFDIGYKISNYLPVKLVLASMKEVRRIRNIHNGMIQAEELFPDAYLIIILIGTVKGNGAGFIKQAEKLFRGIWNPFREFTYPSFTTKTGFIACIIFLLDMKTDFIPVSHSSVHFGITIFFIYIKSCSLLMAMDDIFRPVENLISAVIFGHPADSETKHEHLTKNSEMQGAKKTD